MAKNWSKRAPIALRSRVTAATLGMQLRLAVAGVGAIEYPLSQAEPEVSSGRLVRLLPEWITDPVPLWIVTPSRRLLARKTTAFIECLTRHFDSEQGRDSRDKNGTAGRGKPLT